MTIALSQAARDALITRYNPHCIGWACATASLWGIARDHDLDEPVILTDMVPVRLRYENEHIITDRALTLKTVRAGHHAAMRFYFKNGRFWETEIVNLHSIGLDAKTVEIGRCS